jgi:polysaccharide export outer membrane protein
MKSSVKHILRSIGLTGMIVLGSGTASLGQTQSDTPSNSSNIVPERNLTDGSGRSTTLSTSLDFVQAGSLEAATVYTLGSGDKVRVDVFRMPQYSSENTVLADGTLSLLQVGSVNVLGLTLEQAAALISQRYATILRRPIVNLTLLTPRPLTIGVAGEVKHPGAYSIDRNTTEFPTVTELLKTAGGVQQSADLRNIEVRRPQRQASDQVINVDLMQFLQTGELRYDLQLRDGDTVYVPTTTETNLAESRQIAAASFAPTEEMPINIAVVGEIYRPGPHTVTGTARTTEAGLPGDSSRYGLTPTITRALQVAGGITPTANIRQVQVRRITQAGSEQVFQVDLWKLLHDGDLNQDAFLQDRDTVVVPTATTVDLSEANQVASASFSPDQIRVNVVGELVRPGVVEVQPNTPLNQAILAAGGLNNRASRKSVQLIRLNLNGSISRQDIDIDFAQGVNESANPPLRNNDVVVVRRSDLAAVSDTLEAVGNPLTRFLALFTSPFSLINLFP